MTGEDPETVKDEDIFSPTYFHSCLKYKQMAYCFELFFNFQRSVFLGHGATLNLGSVGQQGYSDNNLQCYVLFFPFYR